MHPIATVLVASHTSQIFAAFCFIQTKLNLSSQTKLKVNLQQNYTVVLLIPLLIG